MEPFTILCSTCQSRIRVRNAGMIGKLANCPKCNSMIMIAAPQKVEVESPGAAGVDSMALTKEGIAPASMPGLQPDAQLAQDDRGGDASNEIASPDDETASAESIDWAEADGDSESTWQPPSAPLVPTEEWTSESTAQKRQYLLVAFLGIAGMAIAGVLFTVFLQWYSRSPDADKQLANANANVNPLPVGDPGQENSATLPENDSAPEVPDDVPPAEDTQPDALDAEAIPADPAEVGEPTGNIDQPAGEQGSDNAADASANPDMQAGDPTTDLPLDASEATPATADSNVAPPLPKQFENFAEIFAIERQPVLPDPPVLPSQAPLTAEELGIGDAATLQGAPVIDWQERSTSVVPGVIINDRPVSQAVNAWVAVSGAPMVVDLDSFAAAGMDRNRLVKFQQVEPLEIGKMLGRFTQELGGTLEPQENRFLRIQASPKAIQEKLPTSVSLQGIVDGEEEERWLAETLQQLFPGSPSRWTVDDGSIQVDYGQVDLMTWFSVLRMLENWRAQSGLPTQLEQYSPELLAMPFVDVRKVTALETQLSNFSAQALPVGQTLSRICDEAGLHCWIDWPRVAEGGLGPQATTAIVTYRRPLRRALADLAEQFNLVVSLLDDQSLWITSARAYRSESRVFVIPSAGRSADQWTTDLRELTPTGPEGVGLIVSILTPQADFVLIRCCRPAIRF